MADRLAVPEVEALYVLPNRAAGDPDTPFAPEEYPAAKRRRLSFTGAASTDPDFASSSAEVLRRELGGVED